MDLLLTMTFLTEIGEKSSVSVSDVKDTITESEVLNLMDLILTNDVFQSKKGNLSSKASAQLVQRDVTKFDFE